MHVSDKSAKNMTYWRAQTLFSALIKEFPLRKYRSFLRGKIVFVRYFDLFEFPKSPLSSPNYYILKWFPKRCPLFRTLSAIVSSAI